MLHEFVTAAWKAIRPSARPSPYLFPGQEFDQPLSTDQIVRRWHDVRLMIDVPGLWSYDLRRSLATHMSNELDYSDAKIDAILGHEKTTSLGHYLHVSFDAMTKPIQHYADWLWARRDESKGESQEPVLVSIKPAVLIPATPRVVIATPLSTKSTRRGCIHSQSGNTTSWRGSGRVSRAQTSRRAWGFLSRPSVPIEPDFWTNCNTRRLQN
jgi:hypothetical protein